MLGLFSAFEWALLGPVLIGCIYSLLCLGAVFWYLRRAVHPPATGAWPPVTILKPIHGLEKNLEENLRSACELDYPTYQVVLAVQRLEDPALPLLRELEREYGSARISVVAVENQPVVNGKVQNLIHALAAARHDIVVISDSDIGLRPDYLRQIVAPLADPEVGCVCTLYRAVDSDVWHEKLEHLSYNSEFIVNVIFAEVFSAYPFCPGCSVAIRRKALDEIGGFEPLLDFLVEDFELGRRINERGYRTELIPYFVDTTVDIERADDWWSHQVYWDQNTRAVAPVGFFFTVLIQPLPFALIFALTRGFDPWGLGVLAGTLAVRWFTRAAIFWRIGDRAGLRLLHWLPVRDLAGFGSWFVALFKRTFEWRHFHFELTRDGRILPRR
ncbi:MAG: bacteriohopanetetrol glucosamine biosynthesis glycosyltransferase HpnI [Myxococcota bacterium]|jgi:ceramide glucosyltransferase|nr:ceramide glucosyltransferase [Deltaproteobacteria bacterium]MCP4239522.1 glycosyltransferase [bacterium]MDP6073634.1 bacteriohopanetetrol glucosamine biosynthesis glycosyltransferase HpnI [Myxococcota bacterium]MDP6242548.1 bacteriohopanetetrol glucosamine biosynthesis glycosyltransferase HpnI [Myxococcota bacterium]MDP7074192.1 bacteriohopanetetrol glucosamine biosynthesis glycosyltransferase HpnI [Myxococcota bacterium]